MEYTVLVTRPFVQAREFAVELEKIGFTPLIQPLLCIEAIHFSFEDIEKPDAFLLTSFHGLGNSVPPENWLDIPIFTVGLKTENMARQAGFKMVYSGCIDLNDVTSFIKENLLKKSNILYLRGEDIKQDIRPILFDYQIQEKITYSAKAIDRMEDDILNSFTKIDVLTLFSARSGQILKSLLEKHHLLSSLQTIKLLCLSRAVLESVEELKWASCDVAEHPTTTSMIKTLERIRDE